MTGAKDGPAEMGASFPEIRVPAALATTLGLVSQAGTIGFLASTGPLAPAMGVPVAPLALLVAVEMPPGFVRAIGNVTMDVAVTATVDRRLKRRSTDDPC